MRKPDLYRVNKQDNETGETDNDKMMIVIKGTSAGDRYKLYS